MALRDPRSYFAPECSPCDCFTRCITKKNGWRSVRECSMQRASFHYASNIPYLQVISVLYHLLLVGPLHHSSGFSPVSATLIVRHQLGRRRKENRAGSQPKNRSGASCPLDLAASTDPLDRYPSSSSHSMGARSGWLASCHSRSPNPSQFSSRRDAQVQGFLVLSRWFHL